MLGYSLWHQPDHHPTISRDPSSNPTPNTSFPGEITPLRLSGSPINPHSLSHSSSHKPTKIDRKHPHTDIADDTIPHPNTQHSHSNLHDDLLMMDIVDRFSHNYASDGTLPHTTIDRLPSTDRQDPQPSGASPPQTSLRICSGSRGCIDAYEPIYNPYSGSLFHVDQSSIQKNPGGGPENNSPTCNDVPGCHPHPPSPSPPSTAHSEVSSRPLPPLDMLYRYVSSHSLDDNKPNQHILPRVADVDYTDPFLPGSSPRNSAVSGSPGCEVEKTRATTQDPSPNVCPPPVAAFEQHPVIFGNVPVTATVVSNVLHLTPLDPLLPTANSVSIPLPLPQDSGTLCMHVLNAPPDGRLVVVCGVQLASPSFTTLFSSKKDPSPHSKRPPKPPPVEPLATQGLSPTYVPRLSHAIVIFGERTPVNASLPDIVSDAHWIGIGYRPLFISSSQLLSPAIPCIPAIQQLLLGRPPHAHAPSGVDVYEASSPADASSRHPVIKPTSAASCYQPHQVRNALLSLTTSIPLVYSDLFVGGSDHTVHIFRQSLSSDRERPRTIPFPQDHHQMAVRESDDGQFTMGRFSTDSCLSINISVAHEPNLHKPLLTFRTAPPAAGSAISTPHRPSLFDLVFRTSPSEVNHKPPSTTALPSHQPPVDRISKGMETLAHIESFEHFTVTVSVPVAAGMVSRHATSSRTTPANKLPRPAATASPNRTSHSHTPLTLSLILPRLSTNAVNVPTQTEGITASLNHSSASNVVTINHPVVFGALAYASQLIIDWYYEETGIAKSLSDNDGELPASLSTWTRRLIPRYLYSEMTRDNHPIPMLLNLPAPPSCLSITLTLSRASQHHTMLPQDQPQPPTQHWVTICVGTTTGFLRLETRQNWLTDPVCFLRNPRCTYAGHPKSSHNSPQQLGDDMVSSYPPCQCGRRIDDGIGPKIWDVVASPHHPTTDTETGIVFAPANIMSSSDAALIPMLHHWTSQHRHLVRYLLSGEHPVPPANTPRTSSGSGSVDGKEGHRDDPDSPIQTTSPTHPVPSLHPPCRNTSSAAPPLNHTRPHSSLSPPPAATSATTHPSAHRSRRCLISQHRVDGAVTHLSFFAFATQPPHLKSKRQSPIEWRTQSYLVHPSLLYPLLSGPSQPLGGDPTTCVNGKTSELPCNITHSEGEALSHPTNVFSDAGSGGGGGGGDAGDSDMLPILNLVITRAGIGACLLFRDVLSNRLVAPVFLWDGLSLRATSRIIPTDTLPAAKNSVCPPHAGDFPSPQSSHSHVVFIPPLPLSLLRSDYYSPCSLPPTTPSPAGNDPSHHGSPHHDVSYCSTDAPLSMMLASPHNRIGTLAVASPAGYVFLFALLTANDTRQHQSQPQPIPFDPQHFTHDDLHHAFASYIKACQRVFSSICPAAGVSQANTRVDYSQLLLGKVPLGNEREVVPFCYRVLAVSAPVRALAVHTPRLYPILTITTDHGIVSYML